MKKRLTSYLVLFAIVLTYLFNCSFTSNPYRIKDAGILPTQISDLRGSTPLPSYYSSYDYGYLTPTAAQGTTSICWAFAHNEVISANVAKKTGVVYNFSEQTMKFETSVETNAQWGYERGVNDGGNEIMSTAYLARSGSVLEADEPFDEGEIRRVDPEKLNRYGYLVNTQMYDFGFYNSSSDKQTKLSAIQKTKELVYNNGAVGAGIYYEYAQTRFYENADRTNYYYNGPSATPNHSVTIVGWDDSYKRENFVGRPEGDGAFIVKNSWGNYHNEGTCDYFYISYYDKHITSQLFASEYEMQNDVYDNMYQYDGYGWTNNGIVEEPSVICVSRFNADKINEAVTAVSTYVAEGGTTVEVYINTGGDRTNKKAYTLVKTEYFEAPGYYLIDFDGVALKRGEYYVALKIISGSDSTQFAIQTNVKDVCPDAQNTPETCYIGTTFTNLTALESIYARYGAMHCIKSFTVSQEDEAVPSGKNFVDVERGKWYADEIEYCVSHSVFSGISETTFEPNSPMTRAMFVKVLANLSGDKMYSYKTPFTDVEKGRWYESAVGWAYQNGIVSGVTKTTFEPNTPVTREQICFMLLKYADYMGIEFKDLKKPIAFTDKSNISKFAKTAVTTCQTAGIINGMTDGSFAPKKSATRAEVAVMMTGLCKLYIY